MSFSELQRINLALAKGIEAKQLLKVKEDEGKLLVQKINLLQQKTDTLYLLANTQEQQLRIAQVQVITAKAINTECSKENTNLQKKLDKQTLRKKRARRLIPLGIAIGYVAAKLL